MMAAGVLERTEQFIAQAQPVVAPVLVPETLIGSPNTALIAGETFYAASSRQSDQSHFAIIGMCSGVRLPARDSRVLQSRLQKFVAPRLARLGVAYVISDSEEGRTLQFSAFNCAYELTAACASAACDETRELLALADALAVLNPR
jgi:hypothetical protein